jgi:hypothetical protein
MNKNDIVSVVTMAGEFVGKFDSFEGNGIRLTDPRMIVQGPEGQMGFAKGLCLTGKMEPDTAVIQNYVFVCESNDDVVKGFRQHTSGIVTP